MVRSRRSTVLIEPDPLAGHPQRAVAIAAIRQATQSASFTQDTGAEKAEPPGSASGRWPSTGSRPWLRSNTKAALKQTKTPGCWSRHSTSAGPATWRDD
jgi:hypothetical protein